MLINLSDVLSEQHKAVDASVPIEMEAITLKSGTFPIVSKELAHILVTHVKDRELMIQAETHLVVEIPCDRCLEPVEQEFSLNFKKHVDLAVPDAELKEGFDESDFIDGFHLDVDKLLFHEILTGWPTKVLCREDCKGICSICGQNLNLGVCDCEDTGLDPRMSVIRDLFQNLPE